jgi:hypothetical protein
MPGDGAGGHARDSDYDFPIVIATMPATARQRRTALTVVVVLFAVALSVAPFAHIQVGRIDSFIPVLQTVLSLADLITAILLFSQYAIQPQSALLVLASGYTFSGSFAFLQNVGLSGRLRPGRRDRRRTQHRGLAVRAVAHDVLGHGPHLCLVEGCQSKLRPGSWDEQEKDWRRNCLRTGCDRRPHLDRD